MSKRTWMWVGSIAVVTLIGGLKYRAWLHDGELSEQLRLAWAEGIPTNAEQFASLIRKGDPSENAAPLYTSLVGKLSRNSWPIRETDELMATPNQQTLDNAKELLRKRASDLAVAEAAVELQDCWIVADWKQGAGLVSNEGAVMRSLGSCLALRAAVAASEGNSEAALEDIERIFKLAEHARAQPQLWGSRDFDAIYMGGLRQLAHWSYTKPEFLPALRKAVSSFPKVDFKRERVGALFCELSATDLSMTPDGRKLLGYKPDDMGLSDYVYPAIFSQTAAKIAIVKAERKTWSTMGLPWSQRQSVLGEAEESIERARLAFPVLGHHIEVLGDDGYPESRPENWESKRLQYLTLTRALAEGKPSKTVKTSDLLSPFDGKPLTYMYDGTQVVIGVSRGTRKPLELRVPSAEILAKRAELLKQSKKKN